MFNKNQIDTNDILQVQPTKSAFKKWRALAESEGLGFEVLELSLPPALNEGGSFDSCLKRYANSGLATSVHGCFIDVNPASSDRKIRELSKEKCRQSCKAATYLGVSNVVFHSSCFHYLRGTYMEGWVALCADFYEELVEEYNLNIFIENSPDIDPIPIKSLMDITKNNKIGVCLDVGHANYSNVPIEKWFEYVGDRIGYIHLSDNMGVYDDHFSLGDGNIDWQMVDKLWRAMKRKIPMTLEVGGIENVIRSIEFLKNNNLFGTS